MNLLETMRQLAAAERAEALATYAELLTRADLPDEGDAERMLDVLKALGKTVGDLERDLGIAPGPPLTGFAAGVEEVRREVRSLSRAVDALPGTQRAVTEEMTKMANA
jgi:hypothetical protein